jgi:hypothetical protein
VSDADDPPTRAKWTKGGPSPNPGGKRKPPPSPPPTDAPRPENSGRNPDGTFAKGNSVTLAGKPKGARHHATRIAEALIDLQGELLVQKAIEMAMGGEPTAMSMCLDRLIAPRKEPPVSFALPQIKTAADLLSATNAIAAAVASGELTTGEAANQSSLVANVGKVIELNELEARLALVEQHLGATK